MRFEWQVEISQKDYKTLFGYKVFYSFEAILWFL
jgi:hypothetical protein